MVHRPGSLILLNCSQPAHGSFSGNASSLKTDAGPASRSPYGAGSVSMPRFDREAGCRGFRLVAVTSSGPCENQARVGRSNWPLLRDIEITKVKPWWLVITGACS